MMRSSEAAERTTLRIDLCPQRASLGTVATSFVEICERKLRAQVARLTVAAGRRLTDRGTITSTRWVAKPGTVIER